MRDGGKGDSPRPFSIPKEQFDNNWDSIFKPKNLTEPKPSEIYGQMKEEGKLDYLDMDYHK
jgi:hypothetical protein